MTDLFQYVNNVHKFKIFILNYIILKILSFIYILANLQLLNYHINN